MWELNFINMLIQKIVLPFPFLNPERWYMVQSHI
nr:MAG TPA: PX-associated [Caudoviricetes sp.]